MRLFICIILLCSYSYAIDRIDPKLTFEQLHRAFEYDQDTHELIAQPDLYELDPEQTNDIQWLLLNDAASAFRKIIILRKDLLARRKFFFTQMSSKAQLEVLYYNDEWDELEKTKQFGVLSVEEKEKIFQITSDILAKDIHTSYARNPLGFLSECLGDGKPCLLSRLVSSHRSYFEDLLVANLLEQAYGKTELKLAELESGYLFQAIVILEKLLANTDLVINHIDLHLIDHSYKWEIKKCQRSYEEEKSKYIAKNHDITCSNRQRMAFYQFINWFKQLHPDLDLHIFIYSSLDEYISVNKGLKLDALWAADLQLGYFNYIKTEGMATFVKAPFDEILHENASAFSLMRSGSIIQVLPEGVLADPEQSIELTLEEMAQIKFKNEEAAQMFKGQSTRKARRIQIPNEPSKSLFSSCNLL